MSNGIFRVRVPNNEPIYGYKPGSKEKLELKRTLSQMKDNVIEIPLIIGGKEVKTGNIREIRMPHDHKQVIAKYHVAGEKELEMAVEATLEAKKSWIKLDWQDRAAVFLKAAELISGPWRARLNAATMMGQSKTVFQAEIDSACELIDFLRFNVFFMEEIYEDQPSSIITEWNRIEYRPLEGFVNQ